LEGSLDSEFGIALAFDTGSLLIGAPGAGRVETWPDGESWEGVQGLGAWVYWDEGQPYAVVRGEGSYRLADDVVLAQELPGVQAFAAGEVAGAHVRVWSDGLQVVLQDAAGEHTIEWPNVTQLALGQSRVLGVRCPAEMCSIWSWEGEGTSPVVFAESGLGARVAELEGVAWWSDPMLDDEAGTGLVTTEEGDVFEGAAGDHLGRSLSPSYASGVFNKSLVPMRARVFGRSDDLIWAVDGAEENAWVVLAESSDTLAFGIPRALETEGSSGRVEVFSSVREEACGED